MNKLREKRIIRLLKKGHILRCNEGTTEFRWNKDHYEIQFLDMCRKWGEVDFGEICETLLYQDYLIDGKPRIITTLLFCWYDLWIGFHFDVGQKVLYFCPFPMIVIRFEWVKMSDRWGRR
ncbi:hypothetical protein FACS1894106_2820 [Spirochaetia bacterium]|nr:hypothetical protein FACS1894106_2820 [Spirochaetia bacterium]